MLMPEPRLSPNDMLGAHACVQFTMATWHPKGEDWLTDDARQVFKLRLLQLPDGSEAPSALDDVPEISSASLRSLQV